jgi:hypothetical protein
MSEKEVWRKKSWRDYVSVHPAADLLPLLSADELRVVADDIEEHGLREKVKVVERISKRPDGTVICYQVIDGRNRLDAFELNGGAGDLLFKSRSSRSGAQFHDDIAEVVDLTDDEIVAYVVSANIHRRNLTGEQNRDLTAKLLKLDPSKSNRQIAAVVGVDHKTVGAVRKEAEATGEIPQLTKTTGKDGKARKQPTSKPKVEPKITKPTLETGACAEPAISLDDERLIRDGEAAVYRYTENIIGMLLESGITNFEPETFAPHLSSDDVCKLHSLLEWLNRLAVIVEGKAAALPEVKHDGVMPDIPAFLDRRPATPERAG